MKKLIVTDLVQICGSDLTSGTSDEKHECMGYDSLNAATHDSSRAAEDKLTSAL
jgi:hypothetical protein